jgi:ATP-binding cassette, subfamily B, multidrug efflux pump
MIRPAPYPGDPLGGDLIRSLLRLLPYLSRRKRRFALGVGCLLVMNASTIALPWIIGSIVDMLRAIHETGGTLPSGYILRQVLLLTSIALVGGAGMFGMRWLLIGASRQIEFEIRQDFFAHLMRLDLPYFGRTPVGDLMARAGSDLNAVRMLLGPGVMYSINTTTMLFFTLSLMFLIDWKLTLLGLSPLPVLSVLIYFISSRFHSGFTRIQEQYSRLSTRVQENLSGIRVIKAFGRERHEEERFSREGWAYYHENLKLYRMMALFMPILRMLGGVAIVLILFYGGRAVAVERISMGELVAFIQYMIRLSWPMAALGWVTGIVQRGIASWQRMLAIMDTQPASGEASPLELTESVGGELEIRRLSFSYGSDRVLSDIDLVLPAGDSLGIIGPTGSGKTTLLRLLPRLEEPAPGTIFLGGRDITELPLSSLRSAVAWAGQEPLLFSESLAENLRYGDPDVSPERRDRVAEEAGILAEVLEFSEGWDTLIGERGVNLSGGQKQRLTLARAFLKDAALLILDSPFASVDTHTEESILAALRARSGRQSTILVSHRVSTVRHCDQIIVLEHGRVVERGDHRELLARGGLYQRLHERQLLEEELGPRREQA